MNCRLGNEAKGFAGVRAMLLIVGVFLTSILVVYVVRNGFPLDWDQQFLFKAIVVRFLQ